jgi:hypothetical protein
LPQFANARERCVGCCVAFRNFSLTAAEAVLKGQWGTVAGGTGDGFMRDDRRCSRSTLPRRRARDQAYSAAAVGDVTHHFGDMDNATSAAAVAEKADALALQLQNQVLQLGVLTLGRCSRTPPPPAGG